jgi:hypothetical protein
MSDLENIQKYILNNEESQNKNKKQFGEVFTPYITIIKMLDALENRYYKKNKRSIFANKSLKWLDNSSGIGNFMVVIYYKLNLGLKDIIINDELRKKHIIENMLYMSELEKTNVDKCIQFFNSDSTYKLNINCGNSLQLDIKKTWNIDNVDIIIGNPPYQKQNNKNNSARGGTNNNLYIDFINKSIEMIKEDGYFVYIHPQNWRKIGNNILSKFLTYRLEFLALNYGGKLFKNVSVNTDFYVLKKTKNDNKFSSIVECYDKKNNLIMINTFIISDIDFIPKYYSKEIQSIITKITTNDTSASRNCIINSYCHKIREHVSHKDNKTDAHIYPLYNTSGNPYDYFSSKKHLDQDKKKVIMSCSGKLSPIYDNGKYGTTQDSMYFIVNSDLEGQQLVNVLNSKLYVFLTKICQWGNFRNEQKIFSYLKYPPINNTTINDTTINDTPINDDYINKYFKLSQDEIDVLSL